MANADRPLVRWVGRLVIVLGLAWNVDVAAQASAHVPRIGALFIGNPPTSGSPPRGLAEGLRERGYLEGRDVVLDMRYAGGRPDRLAALAAELARSKPDVIVTGGPGPLEAVRAATDSIPIVTVSGSDPVAEGWARSLARPGGNVTGLTVTVPELEAKRLELLKEALPQLARMAVLLDPDELTGPRPQDALEEAARRLGVQLQWLEVRRPPDVESAFRKLRETQPQALFTIDTTFVVENRRRIVEFAARERLPLISEFTGSGSDDLLMGYGADLRDLMRRAATHVDRILKGAKPGDLPVEQPVKFVLLVNVKIARSLGITIPPSLLLRADRVID